MSKNFVVSGDYYTVYCGRDDHEEAQKISKILERNVPKILDFFEEKTVDKCEAYLFESLHELKKYLDDNGIYPLEDQPEFVTSAFNEDVIYYISQKDPMFENMTEDEYDRIIYHEAIKQVSNKLYGVLPLWLQEGVATYLDGTYTSIVRDIFEKYGEQFIVPQLDDLCDSSTFTSEEYDGYDLSYLLISYLIENRGIKKFLNIVKDEDVRKRVSTKDLIDACEYYKKKVEL